MILGAFFTSQLLARRILTVFLVFVLSIGASLTPFLPFLPTPNPVYADSAYVDPNGDSSIPWSPSSGTTHYTLVDDATRQPTVPNTSDYINQSSSTGSPVRTEILDASTVANVSSVSQVKVWAYISVTGNFACTGFTLQLNVDIGGTQTATTVANTITSVSWVSATFTGTWNQSQLDSLKLIAIANPCTSGGGMRITNIYSMYAEVTYTPAASNNNPSIGSLGPTSLTNGSSSSDTTPGAFTFTTADTDGSDTVKYKIQIDDSSNFGSPVVDYDSALETPGSKSFTVGQAAGGGSYTTGSSSTTLSEGSYYWRVKAIDNNAGESSYSTANSGSVAFKVDTSGPTTPSISSPTNASTVTTVTPTITSSAFSDTYSTHSASQWLIDDNADFSSPSIDTGDDTSNKTSYTTTTLSQTTYYVKVRYKDSAGNYSSYSSSISFTVDINDTPALSSLGPTSLVNGSTTNDTTPTLSFTTSDADASDTVKYRIQVDDSSNFGSPVVDYTSELETPGAKSFTVGQSATGTNEVQTITASSAAGGATITVPNTSLGTGGTFTISGGDSAATVRTNMAAIASIGSTDNISVSGSTTGSGGSGTDQTGSGTASVNADSSNPNNAVDNNTSTAASIFAEWDGVNPPALIDGSAYWKYDFGAGNAKTISSYRIYKGNSLTNPPTDWTLAGSNTGAFTGEETVVSTVSGDGNTAGWYSHTISSPASFRYYKFVFTGNGGPDSDTVSVYEIELLASSTTYSGTYTITFQGALSATNITAMSTVSSGWSVGTTTSGATGSYYTVGSAAQTLSEGSYYWRIKAIDDNDSDSGYSTANSGSTAFIIANPTLTFSLAATTCSLGTLLPSAASFCSHAMSASSNASTGYILSYLAGSTLTAGLHTINAIGSNAAASNPGTEQFGLNLKNNTSPDVGADPSGGSGTAASNYGTADQFAFTTAGATIASTSGSSSTTTYTVSYLANVANTTEPGTYSSSIIYNITATY